MDSSPKVRSTEVWLLLVAATCLSWWLGTDHALDASVTAPVVLVVAFGKAWLVTRSFMELQHAPLVLRSLFDIWILLVGGALVVLYISL
jgi:hypothetical protein